MQISKYIKELLIFNDYIILPGFATFESINKSSGFSKDGNTLSPPQKEIVINDRIKNNDGILFRYIASKEKISIQDISKSVNNFVEEIQFKLGKGEEALLEGFGFLKLEGDQRISFRLISEENLLPDSYGLPEVTIDEKPVYMQEKSALSGNKNKSKKWIWILLLLIPVAVVFVFIYLNFLKPPQEIIDLREGFNSQEPIIAEQDTMEESKDTIVIANNQVLDLQENNENDTDSIIALQAEPEGDFYLIGGSFRSNENADKYFNEMAARGYQPIHLGLKGNFYIVAIGNFQTESEAVEAKNQNLELNPGAWVLEEDPGQK